MMAQDNDPYKQQQHWMPTDAIYTNGHSFHIPSPSFSHPSSLPSPVIPQQQPAAFPSPIPDHQHVLTFHHQPPLQPALHQPSAPMPNMVPQLPPTQLPPLPPPQMAPALPNGGLPLQPQSRINFQHDAICHHLYHVGFVMGMYSDVLLHVPGFETHPVYKLHSIILARSPFMQHLLASSQNRGDITLQLDDPNITEEAFAIAIGHLYASYSQHLVSPANARHILAVAFLLGLDDLCVRATECAKSNINRYTVLTYTAFVDDDRYVYGPYTAEIRDACFDFLTRTISKELDAFPTDQGTTENGSILPNGSLNGDKATTASPPTKPADVATTSTGYHELVSIFAQLPFDWFKRCAESRLLAIPSDMARYHFAKECVAARERIKRQQGVGSEVVGGEESVVLAFGGGPAKGSGGGAQGRVTIVRKPLKNQQNSATRTKTLWRAPVQ